MACPSGCLNGGAQIKISREDFKTLSTKLQKSRRVGEYRSLVLKLEEAIEKTSTASFNRKALQEYVIQPIIQEQNPLTIKW